MKKIYLLVDYKNQFGSKWDATPYRSGLDLSIINELFFNYGIEVINMNVWQVQNLETIKDKIFLFTSSEDHDYHYKSYIEDIILYLESAGGTVIPAYKYLRANNNKSFMELIRKSCDLEGINKLSAYAFGTLDELKNITSTLIYPVVLKKSSGAMGTGVFLAKDENELINKVKLITKTDSLRLRIKDFIRKYKYDGYISDSVYRKKFIIQEFIPGLESDFKILVFGKRYFIFERPTRKNDFRASGSGNKNYIYGSEVDYPSGIFDYAKEIFISMNVPHLSIDVAYDGEQFYLIEYQGIYFGTVGVVKSDGYYENKANEWKFEFKKLDLEQIYVDSIIQFMNLG